MSRWVYGEADADAVAITVGSDTRSYKRCSVSSSLGISFLVWLISSEMLKKNMQSVRANTVDQI